MERAKLIITKKPEIGEHGNQSSISNAIQPSIKMLRKMLLSTGNKGKFFHATKEQTTIKEIFHISLANLHPANGLERIYEVLMTKGVEFLGKVQRFLLKFSGSRLDCE